MFLLQLIPQWKMLVSAQYFLPRHRLHLVKEVVFKLAFLRPRIENLVDIRGRTSKKSIGGI